MQERDWDGSNQVGSEGLVGFRLFLKAEQTGFADGLDVVQERSEQSRIFQGFRPEHQGQICHHLGRGCHGRGRFHRVGVCV